MEEHAYLEQIISLMPGHVYWKDKHGRYLGCNDQQAKSLGLSSRHDIVNYEPYKSLSKEEAEKLIESDKKVLEDGVVITKEEPGRRKNGEIGVFLTNKVPLRDKDNNVIGLLGISIDITEKKRIEQELQNTNKMLENIINTIPGHVYWKDKNSKFLGSNDAQAKYLGFESKNDLIGLSPYDTSPKDIADTVVQVDTEVINSGEPIIAEEPGIRKDGAKISWLSSKVPLRNEKNDIIGVLGVSIDITDKKNTEQKLHDAEYRLAGMTLVGASIAHELRTPLASIAINTTILKDYIPILVKAYRSAENAGLDIEVIHPNQLDDLVEIPHVIETVTHAGFKFIDILLMKVSPELDAKTELFPISHCISETLKTYPFQGSQRELIEWSGGDFMVNGSELLVMHVLYNLIKNSLYYIAKSGKGNIKLWLDEGGEYNLLFFEDTAEGIDKNVLPHIFERFFTKTPHGAGVGLTFCKLVFEKLNGSIVCKSKKGMYTRFIMRFPKVM